MTNVLAREMPSRYARANPRTPERPMDFTVAEFLRGLGITFVAFNVVLLAFLFVVSVIGQLAAGLPPLDGAQYLLIVPLYAAPVSALACVTYGGLAAFGLGKLLRREPRRWVHRAAFIALAVVVSYLTSVVLQMSTYGSFDGNAWAEPQHLLYAVPTAAAVWLGWEFASSRALRTDARAARFADTGAARSHDAP
ncbi:hypothetical protein [Leucobacter luti]|uniref:Uncharacterized protein n=1 Tax=Leucobacter luti TaxID=340320 RepID=A0A4Q7TPD6_9MICO|nr:hypothetical protein [Leucobacter luti]MBL3700020.1 hypothetical protein [Leucobacter luti]RZT62664.1 hypothetical protein EV139_2363 [Leucobacter luti]